MELNPDGTEGFGKFEGEGCERSWSHVGRENNITKNSSLEHREDRLTDSVIHFRERLIAKIGQTLIYRLQQARFDIEATKHICETSGQDSTTSIPTLNLQHQEKVDSDLVLSQESAILLRYSIEQLKDKTSVDDPDDEDVQELSRLQQTYQVVKGSLTGLSIAELNTLLKSAADKQRLRIEKKLAYNQC